METCSHPTRGNAKSLPTPGPAADPHRTISVGIYRHGTGEESTATWTLLELVTAIGWHAAADAGWTFVVGEEPDCLAIGTAGPESFTGQHPLWGEGGTLEGAMIFDGLTLSEVSALLERFYSGRRAESCFTPHHGRFEFHGRDRAGRGQL